MADYYIGLTGAKKNIGDFLITRRSLSLLRRFRPEREVTVLPHWESLESDLSTVNRSKAIVILGGPGFQKNMYPNVYRLTKNLERITVPIIPMGLGSKIFPGDYLSMKAFRFSKSSWHLLNKISSGGFPISCRDYATKGILKRHEIHNVVMTGCPVWYDLESIGKPIHAPSRIRNVVFTPAQNAIYRRQTIEMFDALRRLFPTATLYCSFHRGIASSDRLTPRIDNRNNTIIRNRARERGFQIVDASFDLDNIGFYDTCDLHIGYRVHGHLYFLSKRKPSFLLHEDGRGVGLSQSLNLFGIDAFRRTLYGSATASASSLLPIRIVNRVVKDCVSDPHAVRKLYSYINEEVENGFLRFSGVHATIDSHFNVMRQFIQDLP